MASGVHETQPGAQDAIIASVDQGGQREQRRERRARRKRRLRRLGLVLACMLVAAAGAGGAALIAGLPPTVGTAERVLAAGAEGGDQRTLLLVRQDAEGQPAEGATLLAAGPGDGEGVVIFLPVGTLVDLPGFGLDRLGLAAQYGGSELLQAGVENALGIAVDHTATVTQSGLGAFLGRTGGFDVEVAARLVERAEDGTAEVRFEPGPQFLEGGRLAEFWSFSANDEDELASFPRQQQVLTRLLERADDPQVVDALMAEGAPQFATTAAPEWLGELFTGLAAAVTGEDLRFSLLPVEALGGSGPQETPTFRLRDEEVATLVGETLAASSPEVSGGDTVRVQVLNGVGVPGVGQEVDARLGEGDFRIVRTDNARNFDFADTRILLYEESPRILAAAEQVRELLGVGTIQVSRQPQSVVDLTIVIGADFSTVPPAADAATGDVNPSETIP